MLSQNANVATELNVLPGRSADIQDGFCSRGGESGQTATSRSCAIRANLGFLAENRVSRETATSRSSEVRANSRFWAKVVVFPKNAKFWKSRKSGNLETCGEVAKFCEK